LKSIHLLVEGPTEETFSRDDLNPYLNSKDIYPHITLVKTKRVKDGSDFKGGITSYSKVRGDIKRLLNDTHVLGVTTMIDFYGLPSDFPGKDTMPATQDCYKRVAHLEREFMSDINNARFIPHLVLHEYEGWLFVDPDAIADVFPEQRHARQRLRDIANAFDSPEEINEGVNTAPSKRIIEIMGHEYQKTLHGPLIASRIGIDNIRRACPHFNTWLQTLERL
jgi:hypothetical protein